jgi:hypothetical protein
VAALLAGCLTDGTGGNAGGSRAPLPGSYYGKYAGSGIVREAELVLETNGTARFLQFQRNRPYAVTKAMWGTADSLLILSAQTVSSSSSGYNFYVWGAITSDTFAVRETTADSFLRLERFIPPEGEEFATWVTYRRIASPAPEPGRYAYTELYPHVLVPDSLVASHYSLELDADSYRDDHVADGVPLTEFESLHWKPQGSFLVMGAARYRYYNTDSGSYEAWDSVPGLEYIVRVRNVHADSFQHWIPSGLTNLEEAYWATWRRVP